MKTQLSVQPRHYLLFLVCGGALLGINPLRGETPITIAANQSEDLLFLWWPPDDPSHVLETSDSLDTGSWSLVDQTHPLGHEMSMAGMPGKFFRLRSGASADFIEITGVNNPGGQIGTAVEVTGRVTGGLRPYIEGDVDLFGLSIEPLVIGGRFRARVMIPLDLPPGAHPFDVSMEDSSNPLIQIANHSGDFSAQAVSPLAVLGITGPATAVGGSTTTHAISVAGGIGPMTFEVPAFIGTSVITRRVRVEGNSLDFDVLWGTGIDAFIEEPVTVTDSAWTTAVGGMSVQISDNPTAPQLDAWGYETGYPFGDDGDPTHPNGYDGYPSDHPDNPIPGMPGKGGDGWVNPNPGGTSGNGGKGGTSASGHGKGGEGGAGGTSFDGMAGKGGDGGAAVDGEGGTGGNGGHTTNGTGGKGGVGGASSTGAGGMGGEGGGSSTGTAGKGGQGGDSTDKNGGSGGRGGMGPKPGRGGDGGASTNDGGGFGGIGGNSTGATEGGGGGTGGASQNGTGGQGGTGGDSSTGKGGKGGKGGDSDMGPGGGGGAGGGSTGGLGGTAGNGGDSPQGPGGPGGIGGRPRGKPGNGGAGANGQNGAPGATGPQ